MSEELIEYRVKPVTRHIITRFEKGGDQAGICGRGEYDNEDTAFEVAYALAKADHERKGWPPGDERIQYPRRDATPEDAIVEEVDAQAFSVPVANVLEAAKHLVEVAVIGIEDDGGIYVASSLGTPQTLALFGRAPSAIAELDSSPSDRD